jgi:hypothetical protein
MFPAAAAFRAVLHHRAAAFLVKERMVSKGTLTLSNEDRGRAAPRGRSILRGDQWFPRRAEVSVEIGEPVMPPGTDFGSLLRLRDEVRKSVLSHCGEPDLGELVKPTASSAAT